MNATRVELIHLLVSRAVAEGLPNNEIKNRISSFAQSPDERREGLDHLVLIRTRRGEDLNIFTGESNLTDSFRSPTRSANSTEIAERVQGSSPPPLTSRGFTERQIRDAVAAVWHKSGFTPRRADVRARLNTSESTLKRAMKDLGMGPWPPAPPGARRLTESDPR
jgi:hypothetical protein